MSTSPVSSSCASLVASSAATVAPPAKTRRRTGVSPTRLMAMFENTPVPAMSRSMYASVRRGATEEPAAPRTNSVATQSTMSSGHFGLCELLFHQPAGEVNSAAHAADRRLLLQQFDHRQIDLIGDERYGRVQVFLQHREFLDVMWRAFCKTLPRTDARHRALMEQRDFDGLRALREREAAEAAASGRAEEEAEHERKMRELASENDLLRHQVQLLERRIASKVQSAVPMGPSVERRSIAAALSRMPTTRDLEGFSTYVEESLVAEETRMREGVEALQQEARATISALWTAAAKSVEIKTAQRFMVLPPFQGYRPKVPTEHSLAPEEFLRKCLVAETCKHYDDCMCMLQQHENSERNAIADEAERVLGTAWAQYIAPILERDLRRARQEVRTLTTSNTEITSHVHDLALTDKLRLLQEAETDTRRMFADVRHYTHESMQGMAQRLESVAVLSRRIGELQRELHQQAQRHKRETAVLAAAIPRGRPGEPEVHTPILPLDTRVAFTAAAASTSTPQNKPLAAVPPRPKPDRLRGVSGAQSARAPATTAADAAPDTRLPNVGPPRAHPPSAADGRRKAGQRPHTHQGARPKRSAGDAASQLVFAGYL